jgi:8-amino-7-oxononanoate synthase
LRFGLTLSNCARLFEPASEATERLRVNEMSLPERFRQYLDELHSQGRYRQLTLPSGIDFSSNDYLGYGRTPNSVNDPRGPSRSGQASRLLRGQHPLWEEVETRLAQWHGSESALMMTSGYSANEGLLSTLLQPDDFLASDQFVHASAIDGARLSKAERYIFRHNDLNHLEDGLGRAAQQRGPGREIFVITEALFGMEADRPPLRDITALAQKYQAHVLVDEAHTTGCFGPTGGGLVDALALRGDVLATVHTGGKALGVCGAYICSSRLLREVLINRCRHLIFTTALPPALAIWWLEMLDRVTTDTSARRSLHDKVDFFRAELKRHGISPQGQDYIVPVVLGDDNRAVWAAESLREAGFDIRAIRPPTVAAGTARLRISIHADHTKSELQSAAAAVAESVRG